MPAALSDSRLRRRLLACFIAATIPGCGPMPSQADVDAARARAAAARAASVPAEYRFGPGDRIDIKMFYHPELNDAVSIRPDGRISLQLVHEVVAEDRTVAELTRDITERYRAFVQDPEVNINIESYRSLVVYVGGEVRSPGVVPLAPGMTALQAILSAGGGLRTADLKNVVVIRDQGAEAPSYMLINLRDGVRQLHASEDLRLRQRDIVIAPMSGIGEADLIVQQYINDLLPLNKAFNLNYNFGIPATTTTIP